MRFLLLHPWGGKHPQHWLTWLENELKKRDVETYYPSLPNPDFPQREEWLATLEKEIKFGDDLIIFAHSLGCPTALHLLEHHKAGKAIFVAGFAKDLRIQEIRTFVNKEFDWKRIRKNCKHFVCINSDNDPYIPLAVAEDLAKRLGTDLIIEHNAGHITAPAYGPYPKLLKYIDG